MPTIQEEPIRQKSAVPIKQTVVPASKSDGKKRIASTVIAFGLFVITNLVLFAIFGPVKTYGDDLWNGTGSIDLAFNDYKNLKERPDVVLLGSSLIMYPFWSMDFKEDQSIGDLFHHHRSKALENRLTRDRGEKATVFSWAIFGQMASDSYIYANEFLKGEKKPGLVLWGIAPRDFCDAELSSPMNTISFQRLVTLNNFNDYSDIYLPTFQDKADFLFSKSVFLYGRRWHIQKEVNKGADKLALLINPTEAPVKKPGFEKDGGGFKFTGGRKEIWEHSTQEYRNRYKNISMDKLRIQMGFMERLLKLARDREMKVLIVNMPLTKDNRDLMPAGFYKEFSDEVSRLTGENGAIFADHGADEDFDNNDFWDTAHMSYQGGFKLLDKITPVIEAQLKSK